MFRQSSSVLLLVCAATSAYAQNRDPLRPIATIDEFVPVTSAAETATGRVFVDEDDDGTFDRDERPLPDVRVSNGRHVVATDADGRWQLPVTDGDVIFVVKPTGFALPRDEHMRSRAIYVYRPDGTPAALDLRYPGLEPTGPLPTSIDFGLTAIDESARFDVLLFADTQPQSHVELDHLRDDVIAPLVGTDAAFAMNLGDILYDDLSMFPRYLDLTAALGIPWVDVPGNHELNFLAPDDATSLETFERFVGPPNRSFTVGRAHFVVLDDVIYHGTSRGTHDADVRGRGGYSGGFTAEQMDWLEADLSFVPDDHLVVVAMHVPLRTYTGPDAANMNVLDRSRLFAILGRRAHVITFAGHTHVVEHHHFDGSDGWPGDEPLHHHVVVAASGGWWTGPLDARGIPDAMQRDGVPNGVTILSIDGNRASARYHSADGDDAQMRIGFDRVFHQLGDGIFDDHRPGELQTGPLLVDELLSTDVYVNLFNGGPRSRVEMRVDGGPWIPMRAEFRRDPFAVEFEFRHRDTMKGWVTPVPTEHLFFADLPAAEIDAGVHRLDVRAWDAYGVRHDGGRVFEVR